MDIIKAYFPFSFDTKDVQNMIMKIAVYLIIGIVVGLVCTVIGFVPVIGGIVAWLIGGIVGLYLLGGIALTVLDYYKVIK